MPSIDPPFRNHLGGIPFPMIDGEDKLIARAVMGEASAFGLLYDTYQPKIFRFVFVKVGRREDAEDLTHQVFLNAWQHIHEYKHRGFPFSSWLYQIARNLVIDHYRSGKEHLPIDDIDPELFARPDTAAATAEWEFTREQVMAAVQRLKPDYQDVIIMRFVDDLTPREVAKALGKTEGSVKLIQHRAIRELKKNLGVA